jgi:hypothetical protein
MKGVSMEDNREYFMTEGCAIFALTLNKIKNKKGSFYLVIEDTDNSDFDLPFDIYHVLLEIDGNFYDVYGKQTIESIQKYFNNSSLRLSGPYSVDEFLYEFVGESDNKPLYGPTPETVADAMKILQGGNN